MAARVQMLDRPSTTLPRGRAGEDAAPFSSTVMKKLGRSVGGLSSDPSEKE
ncbi:hypothetical protein D3C83_244230 [compost metagenome]